MLPQPELRNGRAALPCLAIILVLLAFPALAAAQQLNRDEAESRLGEVLEDITRLKERLEDSRTEHRNEQSRLRQTDLALQKANLEFRALEKQGRAHLEELQALERERQEYIDSLDQRMGQLAEQLRSSYRSGRQSRMKLVLNQDDPVQLSRMLAYYDYLNQAQVQKISGLRETLATLDRMQLEIDSELARIEVVKQEQLSVLDELEKQRRDREALLAELSGKIDSESSQLAELERNRKDLEELIERLSDVLADIPADLGSRVGVAEQRGQLPMPVAGPVRHAFGQRRAGGLNWQGWLIGAAAGSEARSVAYGRVAFADWLRGYGLIIIIDHGDGFMSLYGQNESLLHEVGAWVEPGDPISLVGSNPGNAQGLYFELRRKGKALDPAGWVNR